MPARDSLVLAGYDDHGEVVIPPLAIERSKNGSFTPIVEREANAVKKLGLRHLLLIVYACLGLIAMGLLGVGALQALERHREVGWLAEMEQASASILEASSLVAQERGLTAMALGNHDQPSPQTLEEIQRLRREGDKRYSQALDITQLMVTRLPKHPAVHSSSHLLEDRALLERDRQFVDQALRTRAPAISVQQWYATVTNYIDTMNEVRRDLYFHGGLMEQQYFGLLKLNECLFIISENVGRERAIVAGALAQDRRLTAEEREILKITRYAVTERLRQLDWLLDNGGEAHLSAAREDIRQELQGRFLKVRATLYAAMDARAPSPIRAEEWFAEATRAIAAVNKMSAVLKASSAKAIATTQQQQRQREIWLALLTLGILVLLAAAACLIFRRFLLPLNRLKAASETIARGDLSHKIDHQTEDELGELARILDHMRIQLQKLLERSEVRYHSIVSNISDAIVTFDSAGKVETFNRAAEQTFGFQEGEVLGNDFQLLIPEASDLRLHLATPHDHAIYEVAGRRKDGTSFPAELSFSWLIQDDVGYCVAIIRDISERQRARMELFDALRRSELILNATEEGILGLDLENRVSFINSAAASMLGWSPEEIRGQVLSSVVFRSGLGDCPFPDRACPYVRNGCSYPWQDCLIVSVQEAPQAHADDTETFWRKDGTAFPVEFLSKPLNNHHGAYIGSVLVFRDLTLRRQNDLLKDQFFVNMSHELRTPLSSIIGFTDDALDGLAGSLTPTQRHFFSNIQNSGQHLLKLINEILDLAKLRSGKNTLVLSDFSLQQVLEQVETTFEPLIAKKGQVIDFPDVRHLPLLRADRGKVYQIFTNLVSNAHKFTPPHGVIKIAATIEHGMMRLNVSDNGMGIPAESLPLIFGEFRAVDMMRKPRNQGTGLGLAITKCLVEMHDGRISLSSEVDRGTTFTFTLPVAKELT